jgi:predicted nicotinamide N-methyase
MISGLTAEIFWRKPDARMLSPEEFISAYDTDRTDVQVGGRHLRLFTPRTIDRFFDPHNPLEQFPLWAKIWPASLVLAELLASTPPDPRRRLIEIGGGLGLLSVVAAVCGHRVTFSEINPDALQFARANARLNGISDLCAVRLDWNHPPAGEAFDWVIGSELVFRKEDIAPLKRLFLSLLRPGGEVFLSGEVRACSDAFFRTMKDDFDIRLFKKTLRAADTAIPVLLYRMRRAA